MALSKPREIAGKPNCRNQRLQFLRNNDRGECQAFSANARRVQRPATARRPEDQKLATSNPQFDAVDARAIGIVSSASSIIPAAAGFQPCSRPWGVARVYAYRNRRALQGASSIHAPKQSIG